MLNPYPRSERDEISGVEVPNPLWLAWEEGLTAGLQMAWNWLGEYNALLIELLNPSWMTERQKEKR